MMQKAKASRYQLGQDYFSAAVWWKICCSCSNKLTSGFFQDLNSFSLPCWQLGYETIVHFEMQAASSYFWQSKRKV